MTHRDDTTHPTGQESATPHDEPTRERTPEQDAHAQPPHPPFARPSDEYTDPPGHHRRGPNGPALDVGA